MTSPTWKNEMDDLQLEDRFELDMTSPQFRAMLVNHPAYVGRRSLSEIRVFLKQKNTLYRLVLWVPYYEKKAFFVVSYMALHDTCPEKPMLVHFKILPDSRRPLEVKRVRNILTDIDVGFKDKFPHSHFDGFARLSLARVTSRPHPTRSCEVYQRWELCHVSNLSYIVGLIAGREARIIRLRWMHGTGVTAFPSATLSIRFRFFDRFQNACSINCECAEELIQEIVNGDVELACHHYFGRTLSELSERQHETFGRLFGHLKERTACRMKDDYADEPWHAKVWSLKKLSATVLGFHQLTDITPGRYTELKNQLPPALHNYVIRCCSLVNQSDRGVQEITEEIPENEERMKDMLASGFERGEINWCKEVDVVEADGRVTTKTEVNKVPALILFKGMTGWSSDIGPYIDHLKHIGYLKCHGAKVKKEMEAQAREPRDPAWSKPWKHTDRTQLYKNRDDERDDDDDESFWNTGSDSSTSSSSSSDGNISSDDDELKTHTQNDYIMSRCHYTYFTNDA